MCGLKGPLNKDSLWKFKNCYSYYDRYVAHIVPRIHMDTCSKEFTSFGTKIETIATFQPVFYRPWSRNGMVWPQFPLDQVIFKIRTNIRRKGLVGFQSKLDSTMQRLADPFLRFSNDEQSQHFIVSI